MSGQKNIYQEYEPSLSLQPFLNCFWSYSADYSIKSLENINPVIPDGCVDIIFDLNLTAQSECFAVGPMTRPMHNSKNNLFGVRFKPGKAAAFFDSPLQEMTDQIFTINDIGKWKAENIADYLTGNTCSDKRIFLMESILNKLLSDRPLPEKQIQYAVRAIELSKGMINIQEITDRIGWSRQHFTRRFLKNTGLTPKFFSQVVRANRIISIFRDKKSSYSLVHLAQIGGYFDQAHMTNEFKKITGVTPQNFLKNT